MKVYESITACTVSYRKVYDGYNDGAFDATDFVLYPGDVIFIEPGGYLSNHSPSDNKRYYRSINKLTKIYHNKLVDVISGRHEWTWINDINILDPKIDKKFDPEQLCYTTSSGLNLPDSSRLKDVTLEWVREEKLKELLR